ncbi:MAG TPA: alternative ribosome rescue aminoacyl-tRNA hydrolase ArfB [Gemmatimonadaceae bacterium]|nr:alternative ribosome rescue aminoacyl-tRNA hydrolase ArfB [Gemmatimonadaceae bacterium]
MAINEPARLAEESSSRDVIVTADLTIPRAEISVQTSRSSGAGGQHVNKTSSRVEVTWNIATSHALTDAQRALLNEKLASRISIDGNLRIVASDTRSQLRNREKAEERLVDTVRRALIIPKKRKPTRRPRAANEARLTEKKKHSDKKRDRKQRPVTE